MCNNVCRFLSSLVRFSRLLTSMQHKDLPMIIQRNYYTKNARTDLKPVASYILSNSVNPNRTVCKNRNGGVEDEGEKGWSERRKKR